MNRFCFSTLAFAFVATCFLLLCVGCSKSSSSAAEKEFAARCPEINLNRIPAKLRPVFIKNYEQFRPKLEGNDVVMALTDSEIASIPYKTERVGAVNANGISLTNYRIKDCGKDFHMEVCKNFGNSFVTNFLASAGVK